MILSALMPSLWAAKFTTRRCRKTGLASAFHAQGKSSAAMVIVEDLVKKPDAPAGAYLLYARLLHRAGDIERAVRQYKKAVETDPAVADPELASRLGIQSGHSSGDAADRPRRRSSNAMRASRYAAGNHRVAP